jgi:hypothetical protein
MEGGFGIASSTWPARANLAEWGRITHISMTTLTKYRQANKLPGKRLKVGKTLSISKETSHQSIQH